MCDGSRRDATGRTLAIMNRRNFLGRTGAAYASLALPRPARLFATPAAPDGWRRFEAMTRVEVRKPAGTTRVSGPGGRVTDAPFQKPLANTFNAPGGKARRVDRADDAQGRVVAEMPA